MHARACENTPHIAAMTSPTYIFIHQQQNVNFLINNLTLVLPTAIVHISTRLESKLHWKNLGVKKKKHSPAGNRTPVSRVTGGDTNHYTTEDRERYSSVSFTGEDQSCSYTC